MNLPELLGEWGIREGPLYRRLAEAIAAAVDRGQLGRGAVLPPERALATRLAIGRSTVVAAYELLRQQGVVQSRQGSGTWIAGAAPHRPATEPHALSTTALGQAERTIDLATAAASAPAPLRDIVAGLGTSDLNLLDSAGYNPAGLPQLRAGIARYLTDLGIATEPDQTLVTTGGQQALWLLGNHLLADGGEAVIEDPTSPGILDVLRAGPAQVRSAPLLTDPRGAHELAAAANRADARMLYVMATINPQGQVASREARTTLLQAVRRECPVIDDLSSVDVTFADPPPPLGALDRDDRVVCVGSMSKLFWGGLRVGFVRATRAMVDRLTTLKARVDLGTPLLSQLVCMRALERVEETRALRRAQLRHQYEHAVASLARALPDVDVPPVDGGLSLWLRLPRGTGSGLADVAARFGVAIVPGSVLSHRGAADEGVRVVYARDPATFDAGASRLAAAWAAYRAQSGAGQRTAIGSFVV